MQSVAEYFCAVTSQQDIQQALLFADEQKLPLSVLGGGSNVLLPSQLPGLVIQPANRGIQLVEQQGDSLLVKVAAGENWHQLVMHCLEQGWYGLENLALIPGNTGAAPIQNIGAYGVELKDRFHSLEAVHLETGDKLGLSLSDCKFGYRDSIFKNTLKGRVIIVSVTLELSTVPDLQLDYPALQALRGTDATPMDVAREVMAIRSSKLPDPTQLPNVGSFFKNPVVSVDQAAELRTRYPGLVSYPHEQGEKLAAGWLIDHAGWKGKRVGEVGVHHQQALVLVNYGAASAEDVLSLAQQIATDCQQRYGVALEREPVVINPATC